MRNTDMQQHHQVQVYTTHADYKVPLNFIPGVNYLPPDHPRSPARPRRRGNSVSQQLLAPISNYLRRRKSDDAAMRVDGGGNGGDDWFKNSRNSSPALVRRNGQMTPSADESTEDEFDEEEKKKVEEDEEEEKEEEEKEEDEEEEEDDDEYDDENFEGRLILEERNIKNDMSSITMNKLFEHCTTTVTPSSRKVSVLSNHSLSSSLPDLTDIYNNNNNNNNNGKDNNNDSTSPQQKSHTLNRKKSSSMHVSPVCVEENNEVMLLDQVQNELRKKLPKTLYMTASIGMRNPLCATGNIRRNTVHNRESVFLENNKIPSYKKNSSIGSLELGGSFMGRRGSLLSKLRPLSKSPKNTPPLSPDSCGTPPSFTDSWNSSGGNSSPVPGSSPALFNRARTYAGRGSACSTDSGHFVYGSSSSVDSNTERS